MSRIGKAPVSIPDGVKVTLERTGNAGETVVKVVGPKGQLTQSCHADLGIVMDAETKEIRVERPSNAKQHRALHGLTRSLIANMVRGVVDPYEIRLLITGVGYGAAMKGTKLSLSVGFSHSVEVPVPAGIEVESSRPQDITVRGVDKQLVGQFAATVRRVRPPEPYNAKGIRYGRSKDRAEEVVRRKTSKTFGGEK